MPKFNMPQQEQPAELPPSNYDELDCGMGALEAIGVFRSDSMQLENDPRFQAGSILNKRMTTFAGLSTCSGLLSGFASGAVSSPGNLADFNTLEGAMNCAAFALATGSFGANIVCTYVSMAQNYHITRLQSSGPVGYEMACAYYLSPNICAWRHFAVNCLLIALPLFLLATGMKCMVTFTQAEFPMTPPTEEFAKIEGLCLLGLYIILGMIVWYIHCIHTWTFQEKYQEAMDTASDFVSKVGGMIGAGKAKMVRASQLDAV